jgi:lipoprotein-releasing system ATP-binding protein
MSDFASAINLSVATIGEPPPLGHRTLAHPVRSSAAMRDELDSFWPRRHTTLLACRGIKKCYRKARVTMPVLRGIDLDVQAGELVAIVGQSGCGKSTLLHVLATLDAPDEGEIYFESHRIDRLAPKGRDILRNHHFGMIFQFYHLLPELTALENVMAPLMIGHGAWSYLRQRRRFRRQAEELLERVGLSHRMRHKPRELSGGEMQRAAIARALITRPKLLFADEPTGNLDKETGRQIMALLGRLNRDEGVTIVMVTHDAEIAASADRVVRLIDGVAR